MLRLPRLVALAAVWALPGLGATTAHAQGAEPPVKVHVDVHLPVPAVAVPVEVPPEPSHHHHGHRHHPAPPPAPAPSDWEEPGPVPHVPHAFHVPPDRVPSRGQCRIWYEDLPPDRQPPPMVCERAHRVARRHGGRVIWAESSRAHHDGRVASAAYGPVDFRGVPPDRLPPPGSCRVWLDGVPPDRQPPPGPCAHAEREARRTGGRLLYMPGP